LATNGELKRGLVTGLSILCGLAVVMAAVSFLEHARGVITFPYELAAGEELLLRDALQILSGQAVYTDVNEFPFLVSNYPPLFALLSALLIPMVGVSLTATRAIGSLSTLLCACLIGAIIHQECRAKVPSALCGGAFLGSIFIHQWGAWGRVDFTALLFSLAGVWAVLRWPGWRGACMAALYCLFSLYTKQTQLAAPAAILVWLIWRREGRRMVVFVSVLGGIGALLFVLLNSWTSGEFFRQLVVYNALPYSVRALLGFWRAFVVTHGLVVSVALMCGIACLRHKDNLLPSLYLVISIVFTLFVGRAGASSNYFLEPIAASLVVYGTCWGHLVRERRYTAILLPLGLVAQLVWFRAFPLTPLRAYYEPLPSFGYTPQAADRLSCERIDGYVTQEQGPILTEGGGFALKNGKELVASPWLLSALADTGLVETGLGRLEDAICERSFSLVILTWQSYPPRILNAVWANYDRVDTIDCVFTYEIFLPKEEL